MRPGGSSRLLPLSLPPLQRRGVIAAVNRGACRLLSWEQRRDPVRERRKGASERAAETVALVRGAAGSGQDRSGQAEKIGEASRFRAVVVGVGWCVEPLGSRIDTSTSIESRSVGPVDMEVRRWWVRGVAARRGWRLC